MSKLTLNPQAASSSGVALNVNHGRSQQRTNSRGQSRGEVNLGPYFLLEESPLRGEQWSIGSVASLAT